MKITHCLASVALVSMLGACSGVQNQVTAVKGPVDYVNPYMGNISHLLVPTFPTIHLPNSMLRVYPERADYTTDQLNGLPLIVTSHRGSSAFNLSPYQGENLRPVVAYSALSTSCDDIAAMACASNYIDVSATEECFHHWCDSSL